MASQAAYEGAGIGGKLRHRPLRRAAAGATPYDRPATAVRGPRAGGWLSKLVDPASRIITSGASRLFTSVFGRGLPPALPPAAAPVLDLCTEANLQSIADLEVVENNSSSEVREQEGIAGDKPMNNPETDGISELEQLLKQKTFTRVEFERLSELLRSRITESASSEPGVNCKGQENANLSLRENGTDSSRLYGNISTPAIIREEETASPAEIAKAYMGSRPSKVSPSAISLRSQVLQQEPVFHSNTPYAEKISDRSVPSRSIVRFSGISEPAENGYVTPRDRGRSAIYKMSRSPYFKARSTSNIKGEVPAWNGFSGPSTSSQRVPTTIAHSGDKQVLKRRSSVLDSDIGSFGPIRRIRQKSNLMSPMKDMRSTVPGSLPSLVAPVGKDGIYGSLSSIQKPITQGATVSQDARNGDDKASYATVTPIPPQSSEMARKILQQLDKLVPSPKEKSIELKANVSSDSPSKLTLDMLDGRALRSMEDINPSKFFSAQCSNDGSKFLSEQCINDAEARSDSHLPNLSQKLAKVEENGHLKVAISGVNMTSETGGRENAPTSGQTSNSVMRAAEVIPCESEVLPPRKKPAFQISALEDFLEMDDDDSNMKEVSMSTTVKDKLESGISDSKPVLSEDFSEKSEDKSLQNLPASSPILHKEVNAKTFDGPAVVEKPGFSFPVVPDTSYSQPPLTPTMPTQLPDKLAQRTEQTATPMFNFGAKDAPELKFTSTATGVSDSPGLKFGSSDSSTAKLLESSVSYEGDTTQKTTDVPKLMEKTASTDTPTPTLSTGIAFGASTSPTLSNGSPNLPSSAFSVSMPFKPSSDSPAVNAFSSSTTATTSSSNHAALVSSTFPVFKFGSGSSSGASISISPSMEKSDSKILEEKPVKPSLFTFTGTSSVGTAAVASTSGSNSSSYALSSTSSASFGMTKPSVFSSSASASSGLSTPSLSLSSSSGSSSLPASSVFSSMSSGSSSLVKSSLFTSTNSGSSDPAIPSLFSSTNVGSSSLALSSLSSPVSSASAGIFSFGASTQSGNCSLSSGNDTSGTTAPTFGARLGSVFGTQATPSGSGMLSSSNSTGQLGSSPAFGLGSSSSLAFGSSPFGSTAPADNSHTSSQLFSFSAGAVSASSAGSSFAQAAVPSISSNSQPSTSSVFGSNFGSSTSAPSTGFTFGSSLPSDTSPPIFGSSSGPAFSFTSLASSTSSFSSSPSPSIFGLSTPATGFNSGSQGNDQMNEDSMADDTVQTTAPAVPAFGQPVNSPAMSNFMFSSAGQPAFQFGGHQNSSIPQNQSPFQAGGNLELPPGGSFSLGSGGADKSGRKFVKVRRDKHRKK